MSLKKYKARGNKDENSSDFGLRRGTVDVKKTTLNDLVHLSPLRIPLMNPLNVLST